MHTMVVADRNTHGCDSTKEESPWTDNVNKNRLNRDAVIVLSSERPYFYFH